MIRLVHVVVKTSLALAALAALGTLLDRSPGNQRPEHSRAVPGRATPTPERLVRPCGKGRVHDPASGGCVRLHPVRTSAETAGPSHSLRLSSESDVIARTPSRPNAWTSYLLPIDPITSASEPAEYPGVLRIHADGDSLVSAPSIDRSKGSFTVVHVGPLRGKPTIVLEFEVDVRPRATKSLLISIEGFGRPARGIVSGAKRPELSPVAYVHTNGGEAFVDIQARWLHPSQTERKASIQTWLTPAASSRVDLRNVLSLKPPAFGTASTPSSAPLPSPSAP